MEIITGLLGGATGVTGLVLALVALKRLAHVNERSNGELKRAFERLERDFEDMNDHVQKQLGRISRLKQETLKIRGISQILEGNEESGAEAAPKTELPATTEVTSAPQLSRAELYKRLRERGR